MYMSNASLPSGELVAAGRAPLRVKVVETFFFFTCAGAPRLGRQGWRPQGPEQEAAPLQAIHVRHQRLGAHQRHDGQGRIPADGVRVNPEGRYVSWPLQDIVLLRGFCA